MQADPALAHHSMRSDPSSNTTSSGAPLLSSASDRRASRESLPTPRTAQLTLATNPQLQPHYATLQHPINSTMPSSAAGGPQVGHSPQPSQVLPTPPLYINFARGPIHRAAGPLPPGFRIVSPTSVTITSDDTALTGAGTPVRYGLELSSTMAFC